jgi:hypothetical protein
VGAVSLPDNTSANMMPLKVVAKLSNQQGSQNFTNITTALSGSNSSGYFISYPNIYTIARIYVDPLVSIDTNVDRSCVRASDLVAMTSIILGVSSPTPVQRVAADVDISGNINVIDIIEAREVILGYKDTYTNSLSVGSLTVNNVAGVFPTTVDLQNLGSNNTTVQYSSLYYYNPIPTNILLQQNFIAIRLGDVTQNCPNFE